MISKWTWILTFLAIPCFASPASALEVLAYNLDENFDGYSSLNNGQFLAQRFTTTETNFTLSEIRLRIYNSTSATGNFDVEIWNDDGDGGRPGTQVGSAIRTVDAEDLGTTGGSVYTIPNLDVELNPSENYYVYLRGTSLTDDLSWEITSSNGGIGFPAPSYDFFAGDWYGPYSTPYGISVVAVPEPSAWAMAGMSVMVFGCAVRNRATERREAAMPG